MKKTIFPALFAASTLAAANVMYGPGFEKFSAAGVPDAWSFAARSKAVIAADSESKASGSSSARITVETPVKSGMPNRLFQRRKITPAQVDRLGKVALKVKAKDLKDAFIVVTGSDGKNPQKLWQRINIPNGSYDWQTVEGEFVVPAGIRQMIYELRLRHPGTIWIDDASLSLEKYVKQDFGFVANPGFEKVTSNGQPLSWSRRLQPGAAVEITTDTAVKASGKRSLKINATGDLKRGQHHCMFYMHKFDTPTAKAGVCEYSFKIRGKNLNNSRTVFIASKTGNPHVVWKANDLPLGNYEWQTVSGAVAIPAGAERVRLEFRIHAAGTMWLDDVTIKYSEVKPETIGFDGEINKVSGLPGLWQEKRFLANENISKVAVVKENGKNLLSQKWSSGFPYAGFVCDLPARWVAQPAIELKSRIKGSGKIGVEFYDIMGKNLGIAYSDEIKSNDWKEAVIRVATPPAAYKPASAKFFAFNTGKCETRFDVLNINNCDPKKAVKVSTPAISVLLQPVAYSPLQLKVKTPEFNSFTDSPTRLHFCFSGDRSRLKNPALIVDVPADVKIADAVCPSPYAGLWTPEKFTVSDVKHPEGAYKRYRFDSLKAMTYVSPGAQHCSVVVLFMPVTPGKTFNGKKVYYQLENEGKAADPEFFMLNILPPMAKTPNPKRFQFIRWNDEELSFGNDEIFLASIKHMEECGYTWCTRDDGRRAIPFKQREILEKRGWKFFIRRAALNVHMRNSARNNTRLPVPKAVNVKGEIMPGSNMCPTYMAFDPEFVKRYKEYLRKKINTYKYNKNDWVIIDSEQFDPMNWCFCKYCLNYFSKLMKQDKVLTPAEILKDFRPQWRDFRASSDTVFLKNVSEVAAEFGLKVVDYNYILDYTSPRYRDQFYNVSKDALANDQYQGAHLVSFYHVHEAKAFDTMMIGRKYLKKPYYPMCGVDGSHHWQTPAEVLTPGRFKVMMLSAAATGCPGFAIYSGRYLDAKFYLAADECMAAIAPVEDVLLDGKVIPCEVKVDLPSADANFRSICKEYKGRKVLSLINFHFTEKAKVEFVNGGKKVKMTIDPLDGKFVELAK